MPAGRGPGGINSEVTRGNGATSGQQGGPSWATWDVAVIAFLLYMRTLAPSVATIFDDSLEFHVVIPILGVAHPPGYPLYTLLGKAWTLLLPFGDPAWRLNALSAAAAAVALGILGEATRLMVRERWAVTVGLILFALSPTFWGQATIAEVYALHALLLASTLFLTLRWLVAPPEEARRSLSWLALALGLGLTHHRMIALMVPTICLALIVRRHELPRQVAAWAKLGFLVVAPLGLYAYIPLVGAKVGSLDGTYTNTWSGFWDWVLARAYRVFLTENPFNVHRTVSDYVRLYTEETGPVALGLALVGAGYLAWKQRKGFFAVLLPAVALHAAFVVAYKVADIEVFFMSLTLLSVPLVVAGLVALTALFSEGIAWVTTGSLSRVGKVLLYAAVIGPTLIPVLKARAADWARLDRSDDWTVYDLGLDMVQQPLPEGSVIVGILGETTLVRYFRDVLGYRRDLVVVPADREEARHEAIARWLSAGRAVFITRPLADAPTRYSLDAWGPLVRVWPKGRDDHPEPQVALGEPFAPGITLAGYTLTRRSTHMGPVLRVVLFWDVQATPTEAYKVSARLVRPDGSVAKAVDSVPVHNTYPTPYWVPGERVVDVYDLPLADGTASTVLIILYREADAGEVHRITFPVR